MSELDRTAVETALESGYQNLTTVADGLSEADLMQPSRCAGWARADVLYHQLLDARRALRTFASPSTQPADTGDVEYWRAYCPGSRPTRRGLWHGSGGKPRPPPSGPREPARTRR